MTNWRPITNETPRDKRVLLFGQMKPMEGLRTNGPEVFSGYWDDIDGAWCGSGSTWVGPFYDVTHWQELPEAPK